MLLSHVMGVWGLFAAALALYCIVIVVRPRPRLGTGKPVRKSLLDFSASQEEGRQVQALLKEALAEAQTDREFEHRYKSLTKAATGLEAEMGWAWMNRTLMDYRRAGEYTPSSLLLARRYLDDIPRRYKLNEGSDDQ